METWKQSPSSSLRNTWSGGKISCKWLRQRDRKFPHKASGGHRRGGLVGRVWADQILSGRLRTTSPQGAIPIDWDVNRTPSPHPRLRQWGALGKTPYKSYLSWVFKDKYELSGRRPDIWGRGNYLYKDMKWEARGVPRLPIMEEGKRTGCREGGWWWWTFRLSRWAGGIWWVVSGAQKLFWADHPSWQSKACKGGFLPSPRSKTCPLVSRAIYFSLLRISFSHSSMPQRNKWQFVFFDTLLCDFLGEGTP